MKHRLKKLREQVVVITGASSGIGLATARMAARRGAKLVLAARSGEALQQITAELDRLRCEAVHVVADVGDEKQVRRIALAALQRFGEFDTWVNCAGVSLQGRSEEAHREEQRRLFDTNFWGVVHGSMVAVEHLRGHGGVLINVGCEASEAPMPLQAVYAASKHAVKGFTESLRVELEDEGAPVSVTLVKPGAVAPQLVAEAIVHAAGHPRPEVRIGRFAPRRGLFAGASLHPRAIAAALLGSGLLIGALWRSRAQGRAPG
jgi:short-subunit dehydrogenase